MTASPFNIDAIRNAMLGSGLTASELAHRVDIAPRALQRILDGEPDPGEIRIATLLRLAEFIDLPLADLFVRDAVAPVTPLAGLPAQPADDDVHRLVSVLYDRGKQTSADDIATALGWDLDHLLQVVRSADSALQGVGLKIVRGHGAMMIRTLTPRHADRATLDRVGVAAGGATIWEYQRAYSLFSGKSLPAARHIREQRLGRLLNLGIIEASPTGPALTEATRYAHPA